MVKIYALVCPTTDQIRYIGKTAVSLETRLRRHLADSRKSDSGHKRRWIRKLLGESKSPLVRLLEDVTEGVRWQDRERFWIARAIESGVRLTNQTSGGEGLDYLDPVDKQRYLGNLAAAMRVVRENNPDWLKPMQAASRAAWSSNRAGRIAACMSGWTPEAKKRWAIAMRKVQKTPAFKEAKSRGSKRMWKEQREVFMEAFARPETKAKQSESKRAAWNDPEKRARFMNRWTPKAKKKQAEEIKSRGPEYRAAMAEKMRAIWAKRSKKDRKQIMSAAHKVRGIV